jgi:hypothetical protein
MSLYEVLSSVTPENNPELVDILQDFIFTEKSLATSSDPHEREVFLRMARQISTVLKAPPFSLSVELLSDICDNLEGWQDQITTWLIAQQ